MNDKQIIKLSHLTKTHIKSISKMFDRAFQNDPQMSYLIPNVSERKILSYHIWEFMTRYGILYGEVYAISPNFEGISILVLSEKIMMTLWKNFRSGGIFLYFKLGKKCMSKIQSFSQYMFSVQKYHAPFRHGYLFLIGVDPNFQRRGYANILLKATLTRVDQEFLPCYIATCNAKNVCFYEQYGFQLVEDVIVPDTNLHLYAMLRDVPNT